MLTKQFLAAGHQVVATCRHPEHSAELVNLAKSSALVIYPLEVTDGESVDLLDKALRGKAIAGLSFLFRTSDPKHIRRRCRELERPREQG